MSIWRKSTYSFSNGNCVEAAGEFRKSSYSHANGSCVEVAAPGAVLVRDSKLGDASPVLSFTRKEWGALLAAVRRAG